MRGVITAEKSNDITEAIENLSNDGKVDPQ